MTLTEKVAIVTGAGQGIGLEVSRKLASAGAKVVLNDLDPGLATRAAGEINAISGACVPVAATPVIWP